MSNPQTLQSLQNPGPREASLPAVAPGFGSLQSFELMQRAAKLLSSSDLVPESYRALIEKKNYKGEITKSLENPRALANCVVALNMAQRMGADPLMVMQNLYIVEGRPSWSSQWIIAAINGCGRFSPLRFDIKPGGRKTVERVETVWENGDKQRKVVKVEIDDLVAVAWALEKETGERLESPPVSIELAVKEGWFTKNGSKWQTMPEVMLRYRTASFFGKLYAPELLMGLQSAEEMQDVIEVFPQADGTHAAMPIEALRPQKAEPAADPTPAADPAAAADPAPTAGAGQGDGAAQPDVQPGLLDDQPQAQPQARQRRPRGDISAE